MRVLRRNPVFTSHNNGGTWTFIDNDIKPHYEDAASPAPGATVLWKYRAIYLEGDHPFGQWSDTGSIAVTG